MSNIFSKYFFNLFLLIHAFSSSVILISERTDFNQVSELLVSFFNYNINITSRYNKYEELSELQYSLHILNT